MVDAGEEFLKYIKEYEEIEEIMGVAVFCGYLGYTPILWFSNKTAFTTWT